LKKGINYRFIRDVNLFQLLFGLLFQTRIRRKTIGVPDVNDVFVGLSYIVQGGALLQLEDFETPLNRHRCQCRFLQTDCLLSLPCAVSIA